MSPYILSGIIERSFVGFLKLWNAKVFEKKRSIWFRLPQCAQEGQQNFQPMHLHLPLLSSADLKQDYVSFATV